MAPLSAFPFRRLLLLLSIALLSAGCFNSSDADMTLSLGSVSVGQQLMDLETARSAGLLSDAEHRMIRDKLVHSIAALDFDDRDDDDDDDDDKRRRRKDHDEDDGFSWF